MCKNGPLLLVDDDADDQELMTLSLKELGLQNQIKYFNTAESALKYLYETSEQPFMIVSDINMPKMDGIEFKKRIDACNVLSSKCIPFVFLSTCTKHFKDTCNLNIQGYFEKGNTLEQLLQTMRIILAYWDRTRHIS